MEEHTKQNGLHSLDVSNNHQRKTSMDAQVNHQRKGSIEPQTNHLRKRSLEPFPNKKHSLEPPTSHSRKGSLEPPAHHHLKRHSVDNSVYSATNAFEVIEEQSSWAKFLKMELDDLKTPLMWRACCAEFLGTFLLNFYTIGMVSHRPEDDAPSIVQVSLGVAFFLYVLVLSLAGISGCNCNPAFSATFVFLRLMSVSRAFLYSVSQCLGGILGSYAIKAVLPDDMVGTLGVIVPGKGITDTQTLFMEFIITWFIGFSVGAMLDKNRNDIQFSIPLGIGFVVSANIILAATISGACMNPARALGPAVIMGNYDKQWIYWVGPLSGAIVGAVMYDKFFRATDSVRELFTACLPATCCAPHNKAVDIPTIVEPGRMSLEYETHQDRKLSV